MFGSLAYQPGQQFKNALHGPSENYRLLPVNELQPVPRFILPWDAISLSSISNEWLGSAMTSHSTTYKSVRFNVVETCPPI